MRIRETASFLAVSALVACSAAGTRGSFDDAPPPSTSSDQTETTPTPPPPPASTGPVTATGDASVPDAADGCVRAAPSKACGVVPQCGCQSTETCDVTDAAGNVACVTAGKAAMGGACTSTSGCAQGLTCVGGTCHSFCATSSAGSACGQPGTGQCLQLQSQGTNIPNLAVCMVACDLRDPNACGGTTAAGTAGCVVDDKGNTDCQTVGTAAVNGACGPTTDCGPALVCVDVTTNGKTSSLCKKWCRVGTNDCGGTTACTGFQTKVMVGATEYGVCP